ncbi:MAG: asparagine synthase C-terminal domain-containing protein, partial [Chromatiales bacterium]|nr:asparagine synthase C-terminal domain-containing protein [Chromatiales bacterium]
RVVEFAWRLPLALRWGERGSKLVVRELLKRYVPPALTERPKAGFGVPVGEWLRGPLRDWAESLIDPGRIRSQGLLDEPGVTKLWRQHLCGWRDHSDVLWSVLMFQAWLNNEVAIGNTPA